MKQTVISSLKNKRTLAMLAALAAVLMLSVSTTFSYLTASSDVVVNTFAGGAISLLLDESKVDTDGNIVSEDRVTSNSYKYIPGGTYSKDPTVTVLSGSEECYVFLYMDNPLPEEFFTLDISDSWIVVSEDGNGVLYVYKTTVDAMDEDVVLDALFTTISVSTELTSEEIEELGDQQVTLESYAVQVDGVTLEEAFSLAADYFNSNYSVSFTDLADSISVEGEYVASEETEAAAEEDTEDASETEAETESVETEEEITTDTSEDETSE